MSNLLAPLDNKIIKREPDTLYPNLFDKSVLDVSGINFGDETLSGYEEHNAVVQLSGAITNTIETRITRVGRLVCVELGNLGGTTTSSNAITTASFIPPSCRIAGGQIIYALVWGFLGIDTIPYSATIDATGAVNLGRSIISGSNLTVGSFFPTATTVGFSRVSIMYSI